MNSSKSDYRKYIIALQSFGTGGNDTLARMFVIWMKWLSIVYKFSPKYGKAFSKLIFFSFANTDLGSLNKARDIVTAQLESLPNIKVPVGDFHVMNAEVLMGQGAISLAEGNAAITSFMPKVQEIIDSCYLYVPIATLGQGNTGSASLLPVVKEAQSRKVGATPFTIPFVLKSSKADMDPKHKTHQESVVLSLMSMPIWCMIADNNYFTVPNNKWNRTLTMQQSYNRIDYLAMIAIRSFLMMFIYPGQIDKSKLERMIFTGPGGMLVIGGMDIDLKNDLKAEIARAASFMFDNAFALELFEEENLQNGDKVNFEVLVLGTQGGIPAPAEQAIFSGLKDHEYVAPCLQDADLLIQRFGASLPQETASVFALMTRRRARKVGDLPVALPYIPEDHPATVYIRKMELAVDSDLMVSRLGRSENAEDSPEPSESDFDEPAPALTVELPQSNGNGHLYYSGLIAAKGSVDEVVEALNSEDSMLEPKTFGNCMILLEFLVTNTNSSSPKLADTVFERLLEKIRSSEDFQIPDRSKVGIDVSGRYDPSSKLRELERTFTEFKMDPRDKEASLAQRDNVSHLILMLKFFLRGQENPMIKDLGLFPEQLSTAQTSP